MSKPFDTASYVSPDPDVIGLLEAEAMRHPEWADVQNRWGLLLLIRGRLREAREVFEQCLGINPRYAWAAMNQVQCLSLAREFDLAHRILAEAPEPAPGVRAYVSAFVSLAEGRPVDGEAVLAGLDSTLFDRLDFLRLRAALAADRDRAESEALLGRAGEQIQVRTGRAPEPEAPGAVRSYPALIPGLNQLWLEVSSLEARLGRSPEGEAAAIRAYVHWADEGVLLNQRGFLAAMREEDEEAVHYYRRAADADPDNPRPWISLAYHWSVKGLREEAMDALVGALERAPRYADLHYQMGLLRRARGESDEALESFRRALKFNPRYRVALLNEAETLFALRRWQDAKRAYEGAIEQGLDSSDVYLHLGQVEEHLGHETEAAGSYESALALNPEEALAHYLLGSLYRRCGDRERAKTCWSRFLELCRDPDRAREVEALMEELCA